MTFQIEKRINTWLLNDKMAALYLGDTWIRNGVNQSDRPVALVDWGSRIA